LGADIQPGFTRVLVHFALIHLALILLRCSA